MTTKKTNRAIVRTIILALSVLIIGITIHTIFIGLDLAFISEQNSNSETWRINSQGIAAANSVYESNMKIRETIYNSPNPYTRWISTANTVTQLIVGFSLLALSAFSCCIWYSYITMKIRRFRKRMQCRRSKQNIRVNGQTT